MTPQTRTCGCDSAGPARAWRISPKGLLRFFAAAAVAFVVMYAETWAIQEVPTWTGACISRPASSATGEGDSILRDTAGPIAVLH